MKRSQLLPLLLFSTATAALLFAVTAGLCAQDYALERLENSPRHHEWVEVTYNTGSGGHRTVHSFVAYPETGEPSAVLVVIHENRGLTDWVRSFADQVAEAGYIAIAPDLLSGFDAEHEKTSDFAGSDAARSAIYELDPGQVTRDLIAVKTHAGLIPSANGTVAVAGFCWGGSQSFRFATDATGLAAALVFYGSPPEPAAMERITAPVYGFYGGGDERINATIPETAERMDALGKRYAYEIYEGAGHAYMRRGDDPEADAVYTSARDRSWERLEKILSGL